MRLVESEFKRRATEVNDFLAERGADVALLTPSANFFYLSGANCEMRERLVLLVMSRDRDPALIVPSFEAPTVSSSTWIRDVRGWEDASGPWDLVREVLETPRRSIRACFDDNMPLWVYRNLLERNPGIEDVGSISQVLSLMRLHKSESELAAMRRAGHVIDEAISNAVHNIDPGISERELSHAIQTEIVRLDATPTFSIVQFGEDSAQPHAVPSGRRLRRGDTVLLDCGCSVDGYNTDMTRTFFYGEADDRHRSVYSLVLRAQETVLSRLSAGLTCENADSLARTVISSAGYGSYFTHRLGHGVGLEVHEPPYLVSGNSMSLESGMTHSVEPGVYLPGQFGVRIEDLVCVRDNHCELLTFTSRDLTVLGR
ncbi:MAG: Xaa-Pro peptidase family protein [Candidatus Thorarchaeota archaeon]